MSVPFLAVRDIRKNYGPTEALRGVSFQVEAGELFGLLGPNGAGKTTLLSILACLTTPTSGSAQFTGKPLLPDDRSLRRAVGIGTQDVAIYGELTARENLVFFGKLYGLRGGDLKERVNYVLEFVGLNERADQRAATYSGGMKRRLNLGVAIVHRPQLLLLDEPTTGVDPQSRNHIFERVRELNAAGTTIIYTSHYMEEVQTLCPRIGIIDHGKLIACDGLSNLLRRLDGTIRMTVSSDADGVAFRLRRLSGVRAVTAAGDAVVVTASNIKEALVQIVNVLGDNQIRIRDLEMHEPNLEQVFLHLTETTLRD